MMLTEQTAQAPWAVTPNAHDLWSPDFTGRVTRCWYCRRGMEGRTRCRTHSTPAWQPTSQTARTASCVKRSLLQRKIPPAAASAPPARLEVTTTTLQTMLLHIPSARNKRCPAGMEQQKTKLLPYSLTWKNSRRSTDRRQGWSPQKTRLTGSSTTASLPSRGVLCGQEAGRQAALWIWRQQPLQHQDDHCADIWKRPRYQKPKPIQRRPIITTPPMSRCSPPRRKRRS